MKTSRFDKFMMGFVGGVIIPLIILIVIILVKKTEDNFFGYLVLIQQYGILAKLYSLSLIPNLLLFFVFMRLNWIRSARGVIGAMFIAAIFILLLKIL